MNKVILMGYLTRDPEVRYSQSANPVAVARYGVGVGRQFVKNGEKKTDFFNIVAFGKAGEFAEKFFKKGQKVVVIGRLQQNTWEDENRVKHTSVDVIVEEQHFAERKKSNNEYPYEKNMESEVELTQENSFQQTTEEDDELPF